jgi:uncharacterized SAM-dependent methyltransferase
MRTAADYTFHHAAPEADDFYQEVIDGLSQSSRFIPPKYFYDHAGSRLFESICEQPEYYPTRIETALLQQYASEIAALAGDGCYVIEPGSGSCEKVRLLLDALRPAVYVPLDISCAHLKKAAACIANDFPWLDVHAVCTDITAELSLPFIPEKTRSMMFYPGSSIGNFGPQDAVDFLACLAKVTGQGGDLLIGVDLKKDNDILESVTASRQLESTGIPLTSMPVIPYTPRIPTSTLLMSFRHWHGRRDSHPAGYGPTTTIYSACIICGRFDFKPAILELSSPSPVFCRVESI